MNQDLLNTLLMIGTFLSVIVMLISVFQTSKRLLFKSEVIYRKQADKRYNEIKEKLKNEIQDEPFPYEGGAGFIIPRLELERYYYDPKLFDEKYKKCKKKITYYDDNRMVYTWYLK